MQLVPVSVDHVHLQEAQQGAGDEEALVQGEALDVARVQGEGVGGGGHGAQTHQLADDVPRANTWKEEKKTKAFGGGEK